MKNANLAPREEFEAKLWPTLSFPSLGGLQNQDGLLLALMRNDDLFLNLYCLSLPIRAENAAERARNLVFVLGGKV